MMTLRPQRDRRFLMKPVEAVKIGRGYTHPGVRMSTPCDRLATVWREPLVARAAIRAGREAPGITVHSVALGNHSENGGSIRHSAQPLVRRLGPSRD